jgi:Ca2+-binding RTX toxin-like protein
MTNNQYLQAVQSQLSQFAAQSDFDTILSTAFGSNINQTQSQQLRQQWLSGNFGIIPNIQILSQNELGTANGAYAASLDTIFLSSDFLASASTESIASVLLEEVGHRIDQLLNGGVDSAGDEGEIFSRLVNGESLSSTVLAGLRSQNDHGMININGRTIAVENNTGIVITGTIFNDNLTGTIDDDTIYGYSGNDTVDGGNGNDYVDLGDGNDYVNISSLGNDTFVGGSGNDYLDGNTGNETFYGDAGNDTIYGRGGNDFIQGGSDLDYMDGGSGIDTMDHTTWSSGGTYNLATGVASFVGFYNETIANFENINTGNGNDNVTGTSGNNTIYTNSGNDTVDGGNGDDYVNLGGGNDYANISSLGNDTFVGGSGNDYLDGNTGNETFYGDAGNDTIYGRGGNDFIQGGSDLDYMDGGSGIDTMDHTTWSGGGTYNLATGVASFVGFYNETIANFENINTGNGNDNVTGTSGNNTILVGGGNDTVNSADGNDFINGGNGNDRINCGFGNDTVDGGNGDDTIDLGSGDDYLNVSSLGDDQIFAGDGNDFIDGWTGNELIAGDAGNDTLNGRAGNDTLLGGAGIDRLIGGTGSDVYYIDSLSDVVIEAAGVINGLDLIYSTISFTLTDNVEYGSLFGYSTALNVTGNALDNYINGNSFNNVLNGGLGDDTLYGLGGNDTFIGGAGDDSLRGGTGVDTFVLSKVGTDTIYEVGTGDRIQVSAAGFGGGLAAGVLATAKFSSGAGFTSASNASQRFIFNTTTKGLYFDIDGVGGAASVQIAALTLGTVSNTNILVAV